MFLATWGISEDGKRLLDVEWNKHSTMLQHHLLFEFGNFSAAEKRHTELCQLIKYIFYVYKVTGTFM